jgi:hypothetical protein
MRTLFLCLFLGVLPAIVFGQETCDPSDHCATPPYTCPDGVSPDCTESGYWVCGCTNPGETTCYEASDCGGEGYSCLDNCCVDSGGCRTPARPSWPATCRTGIKCRTRLRSRSGMPRL